MSEGAYFGPRTTADLGAFRGNVKLLLGRNPEAVVTLAAVWWVRLRPGAAAAFGTPGRHTMGLRDRATGKVDARGSPVKIERVLALCLKHANMV